MNICGLFDKDKKVKEKSQNSFLSISFFSTKRESVDRDNLFEESGYSKSRSNQIATHFQGGDATQSSNIHTPLVYINIHFKTNLPN